MNILNRKNFYIPGLTGLKTIIKYPKLTKQIINHGLRRRFLEKNL